MKKLYMDEIVMRACAHHLSPIILTFYIQATVWSRPVRIDIIRDAAGWESGCVLYVTQQSSSLLLI